MARMARGRVAGEAPSKAVGAQQISDNSARVCV